MFPSLPAELLLFELNENNRELERTITALLAHAETASGTASGHVVAERKDAEEAADSDEAIARRMQEEMDAAYARRMVGSAASASTGGLHTAHLDEAEMDRLSLAQFAHREAIYQTNAEGAFAPKYHPPQLPSASSSSAGAADRKSKHSSGDKHGKHSKHGKGSASSSGAAPALTPMERIARDRRLFEATGGYANRLADADEIAAAQKGSAALAKLYKQRMETERATRELQGMGFDVRMPDAAGGDPRLLAAQRSNQVAMAQMHLGAGAASPARSAAYAASAPSSHSSPAAALPPLTARSSAAAAAVPAVPAQPHPNSAAIVAAESAALAAKEERRRLRKEREKLEAALAAAAAAGIDVAAVAGASAASPDEKKKKKKDKERERDDDGEKKKKKKSKEKSSASGSDAAAPADAAAAASSSVLSPTRVSRTGGPTDLLDYLPEYSVTPSTHAALDAVELHSRTRGK